MAIDPKQLVHVDRIIDLQPGSKVEVLDQMIDRLATSPLVTDKAELREKILERERTASTGVGEGMAIPHVKIASIQDFVATIGRSREGIDFDSLDKKPTHIFVMIGCNNRQAGDFLKVLARLVTKLRNKDTQKRILDAETHEEIVQLFTEKYGIFV